jgi:hypothetical protein
MKTGLISEGSPERGPYVSRICTPTPRGTVWLAIKPLRAGRLGLADVHDVLIFV